MDRRVVSGRLLLRRPGACRRRAPPVGAPLRRWPSGAPGHDVVLTLLGGSGPRPALIVEQASGAVRVAGALSVAGTLTAADVSAATLYLMLERHSLSFSGGSLSVGGPLRPAEAGLAEHCEREPGRVGHPPWLIAVAGWLRTGG